MNCEGKVAIVTGAAGSSMSRSIALTLAREGAKVIVNYNTSQANAQRVVEIICSQGGCAAVQADIFTSEGCTKLVKEAKAAFGQVDICVVGPGGGWHVESIDQLDTAGALEDLQHDVAPLYYLMPLVLPGMYQRGWGRFIGLSLRPTKLPPAYAYNAAKAARTQALLLAADPAWWSHGGSPSMLLRPGQLVQCHHGRAWMERANSSPQDIAEGVAFLSSEARKFITGCVLPYLFI